MFQLCFNLNKIHDSVGKSLRTADQVIPNSHPRLTCALMHVSFISGTRNINRQLSAYNSYDYIMVQDCFQFDQTPHVFSGTLVFSCNDIREFKMPPTNDGYGVQRQTKFTYPLSIPFTVATLATA